MPFWTWRDWCIHNRRLDYKTDRTCGNGKTDPFGWGKMIQTFFPERLENLYGPDAYVSFFSRAVVFACNFAMCMGCRRFLYFSVATAICATDESQTIYTHALTMSTHLTFIILVEIATLWEKMNVTDPLLHLLLSGWGSNHISWAEIWVY